MSRQGDKKKKEGGGERIVSHPPATSVHQVLKLFLTAITNVARLRFAQTTTVFLRLRCTSAVPLEFFMTPQYADVRATTATYAERGTFIRDFAFFESFICVKVNIATLILYYGTRHNYR